MHIYIFRLHFTVLESFKLPSFQGPALRNLLSGIKTTSPSLRRFFFENQLELNHRKYNGYALLPDYRGDYTFFAGRHFSFRIALFGRALHEFDSPQVFGGLSRFAGNTAQLKFDLCENLTGPQTATELTSKMQAAVPYPLPNYEHLRQRNLQLQLKTVTPVCINNMLRTNEFDFERIINVAALRANALATLWGGGSAMFDTEALTELAGQIPTLQNNMKPYKAHHYSAEHETTNPENAPAEATEPLRTKHKSGLYYSAFTGNLEFSGKLSPFLRLLSFTELVHLGQNSSSGLGKVEVKVLDDN